MEVKLLTLKMNLIAQIEKLHAKMTSPSDTVSLSNKCKQWWNKKEEDDSEDSDAKKSTLNA